MTYVYLDESPISHKYILRFNIELMPIQMIQGSLNVLGARLMNLNFADYCRMCRDVLRADVSGKQGYPLIYFNKNDETIQFLRILDKRIKYAIKYKENPELR